jgi:hypothetical protein
MEAARSSEMLVFYRNITSSHSPEEVDLNKLTPCSRILLEKLTVTQPVKKSPPLMELEGSLPFLQQPATCPYPKTDSSNSHPPTLFHQEPL